MNGPVLQMGREGASGSASGETFGPQPVCKPCHMTIAIEWIGNQIE